MRTCVHHGEEYLSAGHYRCKNPEQPANCSCAQPIGKDHAECFVPLPAAAPEPEKVPDSTPVTFAAVLRYHRKKASDNRADQAWHAEAVECLVALVNHFDRCDAECECCDMADCYLREARKAVEGKP